MPRPRFAWPTKELLLALSLLFGWTSIADRLVSLGPSAALVLYLGLLSFLTFALILTAYIRSTSLRVLFAVIFAAATFYLDSFERITGEPMTYDAFINMLNSAGFAGDAVTQHRAFILLALARAALLFAAIAWRPRFQPRLGGRLWPAPLAGVAVLSAILFTRGGEGGNGLPGGFTPLAYSAIYIYEAANGAVGPRQPVTIPHTSKPLKRDIVLIVDESVAGNYLDINAAGGVRSGLAERRPSVEIHNYGYAASITNCSVGTNLTLRFGGTRADYQRVNAVMPSVWAYARAAGFKTVYIDAQRTGGSLQNLMAPDERRLIDGFIQFDTVPVRDRDMAAADRLAQFLGDDEPQFILVNKIGAHFPVHDKYPGSFMRYRPALPRGAHERVSDTGSRAGFGGTSADWVRYRNAYRNTLLWNVGAFFDRLIARGRFDKATIIYTSDHGQDLHERGKAGVNTHCSSDPSQEEGVVPLVVLEGAAANSLPWQEHFAANRNRVSHYQIFPTLLALMGYDEAAVRVVYGDNLARQSRDDLTFNTLFNARLGREPVWKKINPATIAAPPASDAATP